MIDPDEVVQVARDLVAIPSITHREGDGMVRFYLDWFGDLNIPLRLYPVDEKRAHIFADFDAAAGRAGLLFNGHMDTKPVDGMTVPHFGEMREGRLYGRGACDMKGAIAAVLCAMKALLRAGVRPPGGVCFYSDIEEEYGGADGFSRIVGEGLIAGYDAIVCCEPTDLRLCIGNLGAICTCFETRGRAVHSSVPHLGRNAIHDMARFIREYLTLPYLTGEAPYFGRATVNFEMVKGGTMESTVPDRCIACLDSRLTPAAQPDEVQRQFTALMARLARETGMDIRETDPPASWRPRGGRLDAVHIAPDHPLVLRTAAAFRTALGADPSIAALEGATFGGYMIARGTPSVIIGPGSLNQAHTADEWVDTAELVKAARLYAVMMMG